MLKKFHVLFKWPLKPNHQIKLSWLTSPIHVVAIELLSRSQSSPLSFVGDRNVTPRFKNFFRFLKKEEKDAMSYKMVEFGFSLTSLNSDKYRFLGP